MRRLALLCSLAFVLGLFCACGAPAEAAEPTSSPAQEATVRDAAPVVLTPQADGIVLYENDYAAIDASHTDQGYIMARYTGECAKVKLQVIGPGEDDTYTYLMKLDGSFQTFPLTCGDGSYTIRILENIEGDSYAITLTEAFDVTLADEFLPFLYPNQYVNFTADSDAVALSQELATGAESDLDVISRIYHEVIETIAYDTEKAQTVQYGYTPDIDETLATGLGICFDYAAVMTAMLRAQRIPTRLEVGYSGEAYHAWISTYVADIGWIDGIISFDGDTWTLMDPTLAASSSGDSLRSYIGDGSNYTVKYTY